MMQPEEIDAIFDHHPPKDDETVLAHEDTRRSCKQLAEFFNEILLPCRERSMALSRVQEAMWAANAAIAIHGSTLPHIPQEGGHEG